MKKILEVKNLSLSFKSQDLDISVLQNVSFDIGESQSVGLVGESGSGKSVTSLAIMGLLAENAKLLGGEIFFKKQNDLLKMPAKMLNELRGSQISMIFQDPLNSLDPCFTIENHFQEIFQTHTDLSKKTIYDKIIENLNLVGVPDPKTKIKSYAHELSGGLAQRVMIALAIALRPQLLIADEPTTALDVTIQAQILTLLRELKNNLKMSVLLISHDMGVISQNSDLINVMYAGQIVEQGLAVDVISKPQHPYTKALLNCLPESFDPVKDKVLPSIPGSLPNLKKRPQGCQFKERCSFAKTECQTLDIYNFEKPVKCLFPFSSDY
ncbi:MAG: ABC transporter ATP-binding protein [Bdellovibrionales bacterium]|nr:ABC transporter ATP-binding protein [Bdellovibrionales bacterium]